jgi:hypothetical protein
MNPVSDTDRRLSVLHIFKIYYPDLFGGTLSVIRDVCASLRDKFALPAWIGLVVVVQNLVSSLFNSHLFDFHEGWIYVLGIGIAGGMSLGGGRAEPALKSCSEPLSERAGASRTSCDASGMVLPDRIELSTSPLPIMRSVIS